MKREGPSISEFSPYQGEDPLDGLSLTAIDQDRIERKEPVTVISKHLVGEWPRQEMKKEKHEFHAGDYLEITTGGEGKGTGYCRQGVLISATESGVKIVEVILGKRRVVRVGATGIKRVSKIEKLSN